MSKVKKRSPTKIIEATPLPWIEHTFYKESGEEIVDTTDYSKNSEGRCYSKSSNIHTHPTKISPWSVISRSSPFGINFLSFPIIPDKYSALPSAEDFINFLKNNTSNKMIIAVRKPLSGKVIGYTFISKTDKTPIDGKDWMIDSNLAVYSDNLNKYNAKIQLDNFTRDLHLKYRFIPAKDYKLNKTGMQFVKIKDKNIEKKVLNSIFGVFVIVGLFFSLSNMTGAVISSSKFFSSQAGVLLFVLGIIGLIFSKRKKSLS